MLKFACLSSSLKIIVIFRFIYNICHHEVLRELGENDRITSIATTPMSQWKLDIVGQRIQITHCINLPVLWRLNQFVDDISRDVFIYVFYFTFLSTDSMYFSSQVETFGYILYHVIKTALCIITFTFIALKIAYIIIVCYS